MKQADAAEQLRLSRLGQDVDPRTANIEAPPDATGPSPAFIGPGLAPALPESVYDPMRGSPQISTPHGRQIPTPQTLASLQGATFVSSPLAKTKYKKTFKKPKNSKNQKN